MFIEFTNSELKKFLLDNLVLPNRDYSKVHMHLEVPINTNTKEDESFSYRFVFERKE